MLKQHFSKTVTIQAWWKLLQLDSKQYVIIINLSGHNIAASRWNNLIKEKLIHSRVDSNNRLLHWLNNQNAKPRIICANAVGIYELQTNGAAEQLNENSFINMNNPRDFLSEVGISWQESLTPAIKQGISVTTLRFGVVLKKGQGLLKKLTLSFQIGRGSVLGDGTQTISWVHIDDVVASIIFLLSRSDLTGAFNMASPNPISQEQFVKSLTKVLCRPLLLKIPAAIIRALLGEMGDCLLLRGQRVIPKRLIEEGYQFAYPQCVDALKKEFQ